MPRSRLQARHACLPEVAGRLPEVLSGGLCAQVVPDGAGAGAGGEPSGAVDRDGVVAEQRQGAFGGLDRAVDVPGFAAARA
ncbi:hypothetical protein [Nonomuraea sp. NPDC050202]|uniref:hypothetical protein n=1 Tax=Nonomuraea sp. NPDC050202 TaxID=3155035 RepID=UPI0033CAEDA7